MDSPLVIEQHHSSVMLTVLKWIGIVFLILVVLAVILGMLQGVCKKKKDQEQSPFCSAMNSAAKVFDWMTKNPWWTLGIGALIGLAFLLGGRSIAGSGGGKPEPEPGPDPGPNPGPEPGPGPEPDPDPDPDAPPENMIYSFNERLWEP